MELSICIPVYQQDVSELVKEVDRQGSTLGIAYEICLLDDESDTKYKIENRKLAESFSTVRYQELPQNIGRSKIRNKLAEMATGQWLIFLDNDVKIEKSDFLKAYWKQATSSLNYLFCGGYEYPKELNTTDTSLRFLYGKEVEEIHQKEQQWISPFLAGNFMVLGSVFEQLQFEEQLTQYGYEDLLFALDFEEKYDQEVQIIYNPVQISEVADNATYLLNTKQAVDNLATLYSTGRLVLKDDIRLIITYLQLKEKGLVNVFYQIGKTAMPMLLFNLSTGTPNLKLFQFYKLVHFIDAMQRNKTAAN